MKQKQKGEERKKKNEVQCKKLSNEWDTFIGFSCARQKKNTNLDRYYPI
jgi:hypothetical protein